MKYIRFNLIIMSIVLFFSTLLHADVDVKNSPLYFITTNDYPVENVDAVLDSGYQVIVYNLDEHRNLEKLLSKDLPTGDIDQAQKIAEQRLSELSTEIIKRLFKGMTTSIKWDIRKAPAFIFNDGESVIYGVTDADEALERFEYWSTRSRR